MSNVRLSFVCPVFNPDLGILSKCAKSLADQTYKQVETIWVLDGPCPGAEDVIKKYLTDAKVIEIEHGGACKARNEGYRHTSGEFVCFFDSDSQLERECARAWVDTFDEKPEIGFIYAGYKWFDEKRQGYHSEEFDPWLLRVNNYVSSCFPLRRKFFPGWNESLRSLQDWDFWLSVVEKGAVGYFMEGFAFTTAYPTPKSISGQGCTKDAWLERLDTVKKLHSIPIREVCVSSIGYRHEGIRLAKLIDADYRDFPLAQPNHYKTVVQVGFSFQPNVVESHSSVFGRDTKNILFWTADDISEVYNQIGKKALLHYNKLLNKIAKQYVEDFASKRIMELCGFEVEVMPLPLSDSSEVKPLPEKPLFFLDLTPEYFPVFNAIEKSMPDVKFETEGGARELASYTGFVSFRSDPVTTHGLKRMLITGRHVVSNVKVPFAGFIEDKQAPDTFIPKFVDRIRALVEKPINENARKYYLTALSPKKLQEVLA